MQDLRLLLVLTLLFSATVQGADTRYVSDKQYIPLRSGPGGDYRITHRGLPSGTRLEVTSVSENGEFSEITTAGGTSGWIRTQYLMTDLPAQNQLSAALAETETLTREYNAMRIESETLSVERAELLTQVTTVDSDLEAMTEELSNLKQISGNAVQLDIDTRRLSLEAEELRSEGETLKAENQRLQDNLDSESFMNGAFAVVLGVIIALIVPRLWPKRRRNSGWA